MKFTITIEQDDGTEIDVQVEAVYYPGCKGARDSCCGVRNAGPPLEPDEPAYVEIETVSHNGQKIEVSDMAMESIEEQAMEHWNDTAPE